MEHQAIDHEREQKIRKAAATSRVPLLQLDRLIKERQAAAIAGNADVVDYLNGMIRELLAV